MHLLTMAGDTAHATAITTRCLSRLPRRCMRACALAALAVMVTRSMRCQPVAQQPARL